MLVLFLSVMLGACTGIMTVPGADDQMNSKGDQSQQELINRIGGLQIGMSKDLVLNILHKNENDLVLLSRPEVITTLYGGNNSGFDGTYEQQEKVRAFLQTLCGYKLQYINTEKEHGFSSPFRMKTHESGYNYTLTMVFQNNLLFDKPVLSGGLVDETTSKTIFDYFNPGNLISMR